MGGCVTCAVGELARRGGCDAVCDRGDAMDTSMEPRKRVLTPAQKVAAKVRGLTNGVTELLRPQGLPFANISNEGRASYWSLQSFGAGGAVCVGSIVASIGGHGQNLM